MRNKGFITLNLKTFIEVIIGLLLVWVVITATNATGVAAGSFSTTGSATKLAEAINTVSICMDDSSDPATAFCEELVNITLSQAVSDDDGEDPMWIIFHDVYLKDVAAITTEDEWWDWQEIDPQRCENDLCFGFIEATNPGKATVEREAMDRLKPFYIMSPCYATVKVYNDGGKIKICYTGGPGDRQGPGCCNFCYNSDPAYDSGEHGSDSIWPWTSNSDAWNNEAPEPPLWGGMKCT